MRLEAWASSIWPKGRLYLWGITFVDNIEDLHVNVVGLYYRIKSWFTVISWERFFWSFLRNRTLFHVDRLTTIIAGNSQMWFWIVFEIGLDLCFCFTPGYLYLVSKRCYPLRKSSNIIQSYKLLHLKGYHGQCPQ